MVRNAPLPIGSTVSLRRHLAGDLDKGRLIIARSDDGKYDRAWGRMPSAESRENPAKNSTPIWAHSLLRIARWVADAIAYRNFFVRASAYSAHYTPRYVKRVTFHLARATSAHHFRMAPKSFFRILPRVLYNASLEFPRTTCCDLCKLIWQLRDRSRREIAPNLSRAILAASKSGYGTPTDPGRVINTSTFRLILPPSEVSICETPALTGHRSRRGACAPYSASLPSHADVSTKDSRDLPKLGGGPKL